MTEVLGCLGRDVCEELYLYAAERLAYAVSDLNVRCCSLTNSISLKRGLQGARLHVPPKVRSKKTTGFWPVCSVIPSIVFVYCLDNASLRWHLICLSSLRVGELNAKAASAVVQRSGHLKGSLEGQSIHALIPITAMLTCLTSQV